MGEGIGMAWVKGCKEMDGVLGKVGKGGGGWVTVWVKGWRKGYGFVGEKGQKGGVTGLGNGEEGEYGFGEGWKKGVAMEEENITSYSPVVMRPVFGGRGFVPVAPLSSDNLSLLP
ncbi:uncharacterized protein G2W53_015063 [Senna tora]|uniref:Uncharacterized protein n=1 Tax=Senna tora TaxID=362788 RepID=A0A834WUE1_9FABA|nr:uncharacterized protein G2W53_015063 [Senna tora]